MGLGFQKGRYSGTILQSIGAAMAEMSKTPNAGLHLRLDCLILRTPEDDLWAESLAVAKPQHRVAQATPLVHDDQVQRVEVLSRQVMLSPGDVREAMPAVVLPRKSTALPIAGPVLVACSPLFTRCFWRRAPAI